MHCIIKILNAKKLNNLKIIENTSFFDTETNKII